MTTLFQHSVSLLAPTGLVGTEARVLSGSTLVIDLILDLVVAVLLVVLSILVSVLIT